MNLKNGRITVQELLANPRVRMILQREYPKALNHPMLMLVKGQSLNQLMGMVRGKIPQNKLNQLLEELRQA